MLVWFSALKGLRGESGASVFGRCWTEKGWFPVRPNKSAHESLETKLWASVTGIEAAKPHRCAHGPGKADPWALLFGAVGTNPK